MIYPFLKGYGMISRNTMVGQVRDIDIKEVSRHITS